ncbi:MerR family transcriptional regulator [Acidocella sp.]|uniref:MerR family transcriptional regulator n=1 Tax=Acidocella sp. TaxID=50710 RepID=UPI00260CDB85|nr:MerR family transcriptional regulator [Acidocella sp.]MDD2794734.1 MerR family transcriptional regulator [Acidocella sp.]
MVRMVDEEYPDEEDVLPEAHAESGRVRPRKTADAFRTISEVADELHVPQHVLRFWETKFPQVRPLKRGGGRRYYRPEDVLLLRRVADLLYTQGYTIKGVQRLLREGGGALHENIPPASQEERQAAEVELGAAPVPVAVNAPTAPQITPHLPLPGFAAKAEPDVADEPAKALPGAAMAIPADEDIFSHEFAAEEPATGNPVGAEPVGAEPAGPEQASMERANWIRANRENERLRTLLAETLAALEELRGMLS